MSGRKDAITKGRTPAGKASDGAEAWLSRGTVAILSIDDWTRQGQGVGHLKVGDHLFLPSGENSAARSEASSDSQPGLLLEEGHPFLGFTLFVEGAFPGDRVEVRIVKRKKQYAQAQLVRLLEASAQRRPSPCPYALSCGGCPLIEMAPAFQEAWKKSLIAGTLRHLGGHSVAEVPLVTGPEWGYRNKLTMRVDDQGRLAFLGAKSHQRVAIDHCLIAHPTINRLIDCWQREVAPKLSSEGKDFQIFSVLLRANQAGQGLVHLITSPLSSLQAQKLAQLLGILSAHVLSRSEAHQAQDTVIHPPIFFASEARALPEKVLGLAAAISPASFFQVNRFLLEPLYANAIALFRSLGSLQGRRIFDLYCGTGLTSLLLAEEGAQVTGIELVPSAVEDARCNAQSNGLSTPRFFAGRVEALLPRLLKESDEATMGEAWALVDPPRAGLSASVSEAIGQSALRALVYISCDPASLSRDLKVLSSFGFVVQKVLGVDQFVQTGHVETVCLMVRDPQSTG